MFKSGHCRTKPSWMSPITSSQAGDVGSQRVQQARRVTLAAGILQRQLASMMSGLALSLPATIAVALVTAWALAPHVGMATAVTWAAAISALSLIRLVHAIRLRSALPSDLASLQRALAVVRIGCF